jgi:hypothetical protein
MLGIFGRYRNHAPILGGMESLGGQYHIGVQRVVGCGWLPFASRCRPKLRCLAHHIRVQGQIIKRGNQVDKVVEVNFCIFA